MNNKINLTPFYFKVFKKFFNSYVREGKKLNSATAVVNDFSKYYATVLDKEVSSKKSKLGKDKYIRIKTLGLRFIEKNQRSIYMTIASHMNITQAKNFIIQMGGIEKVNVFTRISLAIFGQITWLSDVWK